MKLCIKCITHNVRLAENNLFLRSTLEENITPRASLKMISHQLKRQEAIGFLFLEEQ
jgi:hypothetical protein